eukprot:TRINITY_DN9618_c0_g3_i1.p1 TRINITY_DN9618_c0_g3~~TRINITY_DN9618_c0_g3_i1.p1  ORF type:complete len:290 (-),score=28.17 TRINITY_DN9618_c0_g3_i1:384-1253(-)
MFQNILELFLRKKFKSWKILLIVSLNNPNNKPPKKKFTERSDIKQVFQDQKKEYKQVKKLVNLMRSNLYGNYQTSISPSSSQKELPTSSCYVLPEKTTKSNFDQKQQQFLQNIQKDLEFQFQRATERNIDRELGVNEESEQLEQLDIDEFIQEVEQGSVTNVFLHIDERAAHLVEDHSIEITLNDEFLNISNLHVTCSLRSCNYLKFTSGEHIDIENSTFSGVGLFFDNNYGLNVNDTCISCVPNHGIVVKDFEGFEFDGVAIMDCQRSGICCRNSEEICCLEFLMSQS